MTQSNISDDTEWIRRASPSSERARDRCSMNVTTACMQGHDRVRVMVNGRWGGACATHETCEFSSLSSNVCSRNIHLFELRP